MDEAYRTLTYVHLATVVPAAAIGLWQLLRPKGTAVHRGAGFAYMALMVVTAVLTLFMPAVVGPRLFDHFGFIHLFSVLVLVTVPRSLLAVRRGNIAAHRGSMVGMYLGAVMIAGGFALMPGRLLHHWLFG